MSRKQRRPVLIAAGGTGGHVVPALAVAAELKSRNVPVVWLGTRSGLEATMVPAHDIEIRFIKIAGWRGETVLNTVLGPFRLGRALWQCLKQIFILKPRVVLGMGGFVSGPAGLAALLLRCPLVLHEQNAIAGMTNRWLSRFATRVFSAWPDVFRASRDAQVVGNPVRAEMEKLASKPSPVSTDAAQPLDQVQVSAFIDDMTAAYQQTDLVVCRSGAMTVTELAAFGLPSVLVPFPFAVDDHQTRNARYLSDCGAAVLMPQKALTAEILAKTLVNLANDRQKLTLMSKAARGCFIPEAAITVANALLEVSR